MDGEIKLTESRAILKHIAREYGKALNPTKPEDIRTCDEVENVLWDIWLGLLRYLNYDLVREDHFRFRNSFRYFIN